MTAFTALPAAASPGQPAHTLATPSLVLQAAPFERNLRRLQSACQRHGLALRPHGKAHKCPAVARAQLALGAVGICVQKASEALPFLEAGVRDVHVSNQLASPLQAGWLARWAREGAADGLRLSVCVDDARQVAVLAEAAAREGLGPQHPLGVHVEIDIGQGRCGLPRAWQDSGAVRALVEAIGQAPGLRWAGLQAYHGGAQHLRSAAERGAAARLAADRAGAVVAALQAAGLPPAVVTGGGTGSAAWDLRSGVYTELQAGSYAFMDRDYADNQPASADPNAEAEAANTQPHAEAQADADTDDLAFEHALFLLSTVVSTAQPGQLVLDCGLKTLSAESGPPLPWPARPGWGPVRLNDEHGVVSLAPGTPPPTLGERVLLVPGHVDPSINLHTQLLLLRDERVADLWPIAARGHSW